MLRNLDRQGQDCSASRVCSISPVVRMQHCQCHVQWLLCNRLMACYIMPQHMPTKDGSCQHIARSCQVMPVSAPQLCWQVACSGNKRAQMYMPNLASYRYKCSVHMSSVCTICMYVCTSIVRTTADGPLEATAGVCPMDGRVCVRNLHQKGSCLSDRHCRHVQLLSNQHVEVNLTNTHSGSCIVETLHGINGVVEYSWY